MPFSGESLTAVAAIHPDVAIVHLQRADRFGIAHAWGNLGITRDACLARRHIIVMAHEKRRFVPRVDYITSPGYGDGGRWRQDVGLPRGGPSTVITTLGILRFEDESHDMTLESVHLGVTAAMVVENTGWPLRVCSDLAQIPEPSEKELAMLRSFDPHGY